MFKSLSNDELALVWELGVLCDRPRGGAVAARDAISPAAFTVFAKVLSAWHDARVAMAAPCPGARDAAALRAPARVARAPTSREHGATPRRSARTDVRLARRRRRPLAQIAIRERDDAQTTTTSDGVAHVVLTRLSM